VAAPVSTIDPATPSGDAIPIEERDPEEVLYIEGVDEHGVTHRVRMAPEGSTAVNPAFDITPADLVTGIISERGLIAASRAGISGVPGRSRSDRGPSTSSGSGKSGG